MYEFNKKYPNHQMCQIYLRKTTGLSVISTSTFWIAATFIALFILITCETCFATDFFSGNQYTFNTDYNENYIYQWSTSNGHNQEIDRSTLDWIAPDVNSPTDVTISVSVIDRTCECRSTFSKTINVLPLAETKLDTKALSNSTNSTIIENTTEKLNYLMRSITENITGVSNKNTTENIAGNITEKSATTTLSDNTTSADNATLAQAKQATGAFGYTYEQIGMNSENTTSTPAKEEVPQQIKATQKALGEPDTQSENNKTITLQFGDDIKVELVSQKVHLLDNYLVINKSDDITNKLYSAASEPDPATGQTELAANQSNESIDQTPVATNNSVLAIKQSDVLNQTTLSDNKSDQSKGQTPAIEIKPESIANQSNTASNQPSIESNQSAEPKDQTPEAETMPASPTVQSITASNQTETTSQLANPKDNTQMVETERTIQANQPDTVQANQDNGASTPDAPIGQTPVVEGAPAEPASQPAPGPTLPNDQVSAPDASIGQTPVVESAPAIPVSQPSEFKPEQIGADEPDQ